MFVYFKNNKYDIIILFLYGLNLNSLFIDNLFEYDNKFNIVLVNFFGSKYVFDIDFEDIILDDWIDLVKVVLKGIKLKYIYILVYLMVGGVVVELVKDLRVERVFMLVIINFIMIENKLYKLFYNVIGL